MLNESLYVGINEESYEDEFEVYSAIQDLEWAEEKLQEDPKHFYSYLDKSYSFLTLRLYDEALDSVNISLELCPNDSSALIQKGNCLMQLQRYEEASEVFDIVIREEPEDQVVWTYKTICLEKMGKYNEALNVLSRAIEVNPTDEFHYIVKEEYLSKLEKPKEELLTDLERALTVCSDNIFLWNQRGRILLEDGRYSEALETFEKAINTDQSNISAWAYRGLTLGFLGGYEEGLKAYREAIKQNSESEELYSFLGVYYSLFNKNKEAMEAFDKSINLNPHNESCWLKKINFLDNLNRYDEETQVLNQAIEINNKSDGLLLEKGCFLLKRKKYHEALEVFDKSISLQPTFHPTYLKGICQLNLKKYEDAIKTFENALSIKRRDEKIWNYKGIALRILHRFEEALEAFEEAIRIKDESVYISNKAIVLAEIGRYEDSLKLYNELITREPENPEHYCNKSLLLHKIGNLSEAIKCSKEIHKIDPRYEVKEGITVMDYLLELQEEFTRKREREQLCDAIQKTEHEIRKESEKGIEIMKYIAKLIEEQSRKSEDINRNVTLINNRLNYLVEETRKTAKEISNIKNTSKNLPIEEAIKCIEEKIDTLNEKVLFDKQGFEEYMIKASIRIEKWDKLEDKSKTYLAISEYLYSSLNKIEEDEVDYSPVILQTCRSLENEIKEKLFLNYFWYLSSHQEILEDIFNDPCEEYEQKLLKDLRKFLKETQKEKSIIKLGLGELFLILEELQTPQSKFTQSFKKYASEKFILNKIIDKKFLDEIEQICKQRNNSAHPGEVFNRKIAELIMEKDAKLINLFLNAKK